MGITLLFSESINTGDWQFSLESAISIELSWEGGGEYDSLNSPVVNLIWSQTVCYGNGQFWKETLGIILSFKQHKEDFICPK